MSTHVQHVFGSIEDRFWPKVDSSAGPDACWPWMASRTNRGYGKFSVMPGVWRPANRIALQLALGRELADGELACHHCDNPPCCNPAHLYAGSHTDNAHDKVRRGRAPWLNQTHCINGHEYTPENTYINATSGARTCRQCARIHEQNYRDRRKAAAS